MRRIPIILLAVAALAVAADSLSAKKKALTVKTVVKDFVTTDWTIDCPDGSRIDLTKTTLTEKGYELLFDCLREIESAEGVTIESKTKVKDSTVVSDQVRSETVLTEVQAQKLCDIVEDNLYLEPAVFRGRPHVQTEVVNSTTRSIVINLGDGRVIDLLELGLTPQQLQQILDLLKQFEQANGVHVTSATGTKNNQIDEDRTISVTNLTAEQIEQLLQTFASFNIAIPPEAFVLPTSFIAELKIDGQKMKVPLEGETVFWTQEGQQNDFVPVEIVEMNLVGISPLGPVTVGLNHEKDNSGRIFLPDGRGKFAMELMVHPVMTFTQDGTVAETAQAVGITGNLRTPARPKFRMKTKGKHDLTLGQIQRKTDKPPTLKLKKFLFSFPAKVFAFEDDFEMK